jgi:hypothetical protein
MVFCRHFVSNVLYLKNYYTFYAKAAYQMFDYSEDDIRRAAEIRDWLVKQISDKQDEIDRLRATLSLVDTLLKKGSFRSASSLESPIALPSSSGDTNSRTHASTITSEDATREDITGQNPTETVGRNNEDDKSVSKEIRPLIRLRDQLLLANAELTQSSIDILPADGIVLNTNTPPFKSFFLNRILEGMKTKDSEKISHGQMNEVDILNYIVEEDENGVIKRIRISNYRDKERLNEIFNTSAWVFSRMTEKSGR